MHSIAVAQTSPVRGGVQANLDEHLRLAQIAAAEGAEVVVFPELSLTGYELNSARQLAFSEDDARLAPLVEAAISTGITLIVGAPVQIGSALHIGAFVIPPHRIPELYTKHRLGSFSASAACDGTVPPAEATVFQPGTRNPLVRLRRTTAAVAICADIGSASHPQRAAENGASAYLASMFVIPSDFESDSVKLRSYAVQHSMIVALANFGRSTGGLAAAGRSSIWSEAGELLVQLSASGSGVALATRMAAGWRTTAVMLT